MVEFLTKTIGYEMGDIMVMGRSIGSGPALYIGSLYSVAGLILISPFLSLCEVVEDLYGGVASGLLQQRFDNKHRAKQVKCGCLLVHGVNDQLIS